LSTNTIYSPQYTGPDGEYGVVTRGDGNRVGEEDGEQASPDATF